MSDAITNKILTVIKDLNILKKSIDELKDWDSLLEILRNIVSITNFAISVVLAIEVIADKLATDIFKISSTEKLNSAIILLDKYIKLPWYLEIFDGPIFKILISIVVSMLNKWFGKRWDTKEANDSLYLGIDYVELMKGNEMNKIYEG
jgi:hypothetical protein